MATIIASQPSYIEIWASLESADNATMKEVLATHHHDGRKVDVKSILTIIENILLRSTPSLSDAPSGSLFKRIAEDEISQPSSVVKLKALTDIIKKISNELVSPSKNVFVTATVDGGNSLKPIGTKMTCNCKCPGGGDVYATTMTLLRDITEYSQLSKPVYDEIVKLVTAIVGVAKCIVGFNDLLLQEGIALKVPPFSAAMDYIAKAAYWAILSTVICASQIASLKLSQESTQLWDLSRLTIEGTRIQEILKNQLTICQGLIEGQIAEKSKTEYWHLVRDICDVRQPDSMKILKTLIFDKHGWQHLVDRSHRVGS